MFKIVSPMPMITDISPVEYTFNVQAMSSDKLPFIVPGFFAIGPRNDDQGLWKYATFVSARHMHCNQVEELVMHVIKSEIRAAAALKTMKEINRGAQKFKRKVFAEVELQLDQFGLQVYDTNFKQLKEVPWYNVRQRKARIEATTQTIDGTSCRVGVNQVPHRDKRTISY
ncbi:hypothetical protein POM88_042269 [Heracleum sosnowskyi]|uniref:Flotillin-like n=1 Tax=Heracleum sosnowskyi TaxID=360622 RepID=A0AAD8MC24_9APIA|nr:hypothetical protein POM88_042269 [Heracleum sosnowskyi]